MEKKTDMQNINEAALVNYIRQRLYSSVLEESIIADLTSKGYTLSYAKSIVEYVKSLDKHHSEDMQKQGPAPKPIPASMKSQPEDNLTSPYPSTPKIVTLLGDFSDVKEEEPIVKKKQSVLVPLIILVLMVAFISISMYFSQDKKPIEQKSLTDISFTLTVPKQTYTSKDLILVTTTFKISPSPQGKKLSVDGMYRILNSSQSIIYEAKDTKEISDGSVATFQLPLDKLGRSGRYYIYSQISYPFGKISSARSDYFNVTVQNATKSGGKQISNKINSSFANSTVMNQSIFFSRQNFSTISTISADSTNPTNPIYSNNSNNSNTGDSITNNSITNNSIANLALGQKDTALYVSGENEVLEERQERLSYLATIDSAKAFLHLNPPNNSAAALLCKNLSSMVMIDSCMQELAKESKNYAFCDETVQTYIKDLCYISYVLDTKDYDKCNLIDSQNARKTCFMLKPQNQKSDAI